MEDDKENVRPKMKPRKPTPLLASNIQNVHLRVRKGKRIALKTLAQTDVMPSTSNTKINEKKSTTEKNKLVSDTKHVTNRNRDEELDWDFKVFQDLHESFISISSDDDTEHTKEEFDENKQRNCLGERLAVTGDMVCINNDYTDDMLEYLLKVERKPLATPPITRNTRASILNWFMKVNGPLGNPAIIQTACWYLDSSLGIGNTQHGILQVVSAACYLIAQKIHGQKDRVSAARLVKCANNAFTLKGLFAAEKAVLDMLDFPVQPVTPHEFITYLALWCDSVHPGDLEVAANFLCMSGLMVLKELCEEYPSVIACATTKSAVQLLKRKDLEKRLQLCPMYKAAEKKATNLPHTCAILRSAVRMIAEPIYEFKVPLEHYDVPPHYIAKQIINSARLLTIDELS